MTSIVPAAAGATGGALSKARLTRVSSRPVWVRCGAVERGLWSRVKPASPGFEPEASRVRAPRGIRVRNSDVELVADPNKVALTLTG